MRKYVVKNGHSHAHVVHGIPGFAASLPRLWDNPLTREVAEHNKNLYRKSARK